MIYILLVILIIGLGYAIKDKKKYCIISGTLMFLLMLFRDPKLGNSDTVSLYIPSFYRINVFSISQLLQYYHNTDVFFYIITKVITLFTTNLNIYFGICALPFCFFATRLIYKYSKMPVLSFIMLISLNYYAWSYIIIRHTVALAFIILSYDYIKNNKIIKFVCCVLIASLFHKSAIIFLIAYPIANKIKLSSKKMNLILIALIPIVVFAGKYIINFGISFIKSGDYTLYKTRQDTMGIGMFLIYYIPFIVSCFLDKNMEKERVNYNIVFVGLVFSMLTIHLAEFFRIGMYFLIFNILMLPNIFSELSDTKNKKIMYWIMVICFIMYMLKSFNVLGLIPYYSNVIKFY